MAATPDQLAQARELFERYAGQVLARCRQLLKDPSDAQDACQEVFLRLLRSGGDFRQECEWMTWLYRVATNVCLTRLRDEGRRGATWQLQLQATLPGNAPSPERRVLDGALLRQVLEGRDEIDQRIALYHFHDGLSQGEIAELVELSRATVNKRIGALREAARRLREVS